MKFLLLLLLPVFALTFTACDIKHHVLRASQQLDTLHREFDWFFCDLDEQNPDHY